MINNRPELFIFHFSGVPRKFLLFFFLNKNNAGLGVLENLESDVTWFSSNRKTEEENLYKEEIIKKKT